MDASVDSSTTGDGLWLTSTRTLAGGAAPVDNTSTPLPLPAPSPNPEANELLELESPLEEPEPEPLPLPEAKTPLVSE